MAVGLDDALLGWLVASAGDVIARRLRGDPAKRAMRQVVAQAVAATVVEVAGHLDEDQGEHMRSALRTRDIPPNVDGVPVGGEAELRHVLYAWTAALDHPEFGEPGYLSRLGVDTHLLADTLTDQIAAGIQRNARGGGALSPLVEWRWRDDTTDRLARIENKVDARTEPAEPLGGGLPGGTPDFTGRQQALEALAIRIRAHDPAGTVVAIHAVDGMAGVGKTELAVRAAHQHKHRYPDGQHFINLHGYTPGVEPMRPAAALEELLRQAGVPGQAIPADLAGRQARWQALMATRQALVLLDNALDTDQVRPLLPHAAGCLVLITSRTRLPDLPGAKALRLDVLPGGEAMELFTRLANTNRALDPAMVAEVVDLVGRLPIAVQALAGLLDGGYTEADLADELAEAKQRVGLVDPTSPLDVGIRAAFETQLRRLDQPHQQTFRILGAYPGPSIGVAQFAACADLPIATAGAMLRGLADRSLLTLSRDSAGYRRYELHDLVRALARTHAASHLSKEEQAAAITRLANWYATAMTAIARLLARVRRATGSDPEGTEAEAKVEGLDLDRLDTASQWIAAEQSNLLAFAEVAAGAPAAEVCSQAARNLFYLDYYATAQALYHAAVGFYRQAGDWAGEATAWRGLGEVARLTGDYPAAAEHYRAAQTTFIGIGDRTGVAEARLGLADVARLTGDYPAAAERFHAARTTFVAVGVLGGVAEARLGLGDVARLTGDYPAAAGHFHAARTTFVEIGDRAGEADARRALGDVALATGDFPAAVDHYRAAQTTYAEIGNRAGEAGAQRALGDVALATGDFPAAAKHHRATQTTYAEIGDQALEAEELVVQGDVAKAQEERDDARELWKRAHRIYDEMAGPPAATVRDLLDRREQRRTIAEVGVADPHQTHPSASS